MEVFACKFIHDRKSLDKRDKNLAIIRKKAELRLPILRVNSVEGLLQFAPFVTFIELGLFIP